MKRIAVTDDQTIREILPQPSEEDVIIERDGLPVAVIMPLDEEEYQWYLQEHDPAFIESIARARKQFEEGKVTRLDDVKKELGLE